MIDLSVRGLVKGFEQGNDILKGITFDVNAGERVGILGRNGCGKTTFFRILSGELQPDAGTVSIASGRRLGLISQIPVYPDGWTTEDVLREAHRRLYDMEARMNELTARMATDDSPALLSEYDRLSENFRRLGGYDMEHERNRVANGLDIPAAMRAQPFDSLSGGEKTRVNLARLILEDTDILLLDEPTNHLDLRATEWLEAYLLHFRGTVLVISHDRYFLDRVVQRSIDFTSGQAEFYSGNYSFYVVERQRRFDEQLKKYEKDQAKLQQLTEAAAKLHLWAFMGNDKLHKRAFSIEKRMEKLETTERPTEARKLNVHFTAQEFRGDDVLTMSGLGKRYGERTLFHDLDLTVTGGERIALIGDNGTGKSTLIKMIVDEVCSAGRPCARHTCRRSSALPCRSAPCSTRCSTSASARRRRRATSSAPTAFAARMCSSPCRRSRAASCPGCGCACSCAGKSISSSSTSRRTISTSPAASGSRTR